ncbi:MAG TPA: CDP-diacylglycerol--serine O-phosphatidyltransferase [Polyangiaceae bacterium]|nr:CDP-diacylglycerol--serine O-phosphatidyltransferase [Polyangiaceae bacterium]
MSARGKGRRSRHIQRLDLQRTLFVLPNLITLCSIFCGFNAIRVVAMDRPTDDDFYKAAILLMFATFFDLMDGRVARMTRTQSAFGLQLDSLSDIVSFGVAPSILMYKWVLFRHSMAGIFVAFMFTACGAIRLARFNVLSSSSSGTPLKPSKYIVGLPIPPAAGILISLLVANHAVGGALGHERYTLTIFVIMVALSLFMVSTIKFRSFKEISFNTGTALFVTFVIGSSAVVWHFSKPQFVLLWLLGFYIFIGLVETIRHVATSLQQRNAPPVEGSAPPQERPAEH